MRVEELPLHPLNRSFDWEHRYGPFTTLTEAQATAFDADGFFVVEDVFGGAELASVVDELDRCEATVEQLLRGLEGERLSIAEAGAITFVPNLAHRSDLLARFARHPFLLGLVADLVGPDADLYWDQAVYKKPDKPRRFPWHQDNGYAFVQPQQYLTCWVALTDATVSNGCPQVAPGLHRRGTLEHHYVEPLGWQIFDEAPEVVPAPVKAGGLVVFSSLTPHLTGPNSTDGVRKSYILQYSPVGAEVITDDGLGNVQRRAVGEQPHVLPVLRHGQPVTQLE